MNILVNIAADSTSGNNWIMLVVLGVLFVLMIVMSIVPQKKRQKETQKMMESLKPGTKIKTIGGFIGEIKTIDAQAGVITLDLSAKLDGSQIVAIDRSAVYTVMQPAADGTLEEVKDEPELAKDDVAPVVEEKEEKKDN
ncbi:MAG: preprotein translocase subunit YajC [Christensenella sp.]|nr:preprotein translocase subunit YajC [Christensenella sp.]